jgi:hypothetical protein
LTDLHAHCDELIVLHEGLIAAAGAPGEVLSAQGGPLLLEVEGLDAAGIAGVERSVAEHGGRVLLRAPSPAALRALYRRLSR